MNRELLEKGISELGGQISEEQIRQFSEYSEMLKEWNEKMNLTAITDDDGIAVKHFLDSILPLYHSEIPEGAKIGDIGTGAGFPGLPIKIMRPDLKVTLIDSLNKRVTFLKAVVDKLGLSDVECIHGRAEDLGKDKKYRERFDFIVSRAVANMKVLGEYCLPFVKVGGKFVALKAEEIEEELAEAKAMLGNLGAGKTDVVTAPLPQSDMVRKIVVVEKKNSTPPQFPRRPNKIK